MNSRSAPATLLSLAGVALSVCPGFAQSVPSAPLRIKGSVSVPGLQGGVLMLPIKCDTRGNLYVRGYDPEDITGVPVVKLTREGERAATFAMHSVSGFEKAEVWDFAIDFRGDVYLLADKAVGKKSIVKFSDKGNFTSSIDVIPNLDATSLAVLPSGEFLVSGRLYSPDNPSLPGRPFTAILAQDGAIIRELLLPEDVKAEPSPQGARTSQGGEPIPKAANPEKQPVSSAIGMGMASVAEDGNIYLMRRLEQPVMFVISPAGEVLRRLVLSSPGEGFRPRTFKVAGGRIVVQFDRSSKPTGPFEQVFCLFDWSTGEKLVEYTAPPRVGGAFACYSNNNFTFLGSAENLDLLVYQASP